MSGGSASELAASFVGGFVVISIVALVWALVLFWGRGRRQDWAFSLGLSTAATAPGVVLIVELSVRTGLHELSGGVSLSCSTLTQWFCWLGGLLLAPVFLLSAFLARTRSVPFRVYALQLLQLVLWPWALVVTLFVA